MRLTLITTILLLFFNFTINAQFKEKAIFKLNNTVDDFQCVGYYMAHRSNGFIYTYKNLPITSSNKIISHTINPTGFSIALIRKKKNEIEIYSSLKRDQKIATIKEKRKKLQVNPYPLSLCYSSDAKELIVANTIGEFIVYSTQDYLPKRYINTKNIYSHITMSPNNYYIAAVDSNRLDIWDFESGKIRTSLLLPNEINHISFSNDSRNMAVSCGEGGLILYDTRSFNIQRDFKDLGSITALSFHSEGKYLCAAQNDKSIILINLKTNRSEFMMDNYEDIPLTGIKNLVFCNSLEKDQAVILNNTSRHIMFWVLTGFKPLYENILDEKVDDLMNNWITQMNGESMEDYSIRVNDETRTTQQAMFEEQAATDIIKDRVSLKNPFMETNESKNTLTIGFNALPAIILDVPSQEINSFSDGKVTFSNEIYLLNEEDEFEIAYVEVTNETSKKVYIYNNIKRNVIVDVFAATIEDDFIPLDIMQTVKAENIKLEERKKEIMEEKKEEAFITDKTEITVNSSVTPDIDVNGNKIFNYNINYQYNVRKGFSFQEDFPSGQFMTVKSNAAISMLQIIKQTLEENLSSYINEGQIVEISITGTADSDKIRGKIMYNDTYGPYTNEPYYKEDVLSNITITKKTGITQNEQLAFVRAAGVKNWISENIDVFKKAKVKYIYKVEIADKKGGQFRRIKVDVVIKDALKNKK